MFKLSRVIAFGLSMAASAAFAQTTPQGGGAEQPKPIEPGSLAGQRTSSMGNAHGLIEKMKTDLKLDANQESALQAVVQEHEKAMGALRNEMRQSPEMTKQLNELREKMKKASEANDQDAIKQASDEMQALRKTQMDRLGPTREKMTKAQEGLKDKMRTVLREDQKAAFDKLWEENMAPSAAGRARSNPRILRSLVERMQDVTADQKRQIAELFKQFDEATKGQKDRSPAMFESQNQKLYDSIMSVLTPEQREKVQDRLQGRPGAMPRRPQPQGASNPTDKPETKP